MGAKELDIPNNDAPHYLTVLSDYICNTGLEKLPHEVIARARWLIADTLPLIALGMQVEEMQALAGRQLAADPKGDASVIGLGRRTAPSVAALLNGTARTWLEFVEENIYAKGLPASQVIPAALAMAEQRRASGRELLRALILGYKASCRVSRATKTKLAIHPSGAFGVIGAAVAAGKLAQLDRDAMRALINVSATLGLATSRKAIIDGATVGRGYGGASGYARGWTDGFKPDDTAVTIAAVEGPRLIGCGAGYGPAEDVLYVLADSIATLRSPQVSGGDMVLVLAPMAATNLANAGLSKADVKRELMRLATRPVCEVKRRGSIAETHPMHWNKIADPNDDNARVPFVRNLKNLIILVAGGWGSGGAFSSLCAGWGARRSHPVQRRVQFPF